MIFKKGEILSKHEKWTYNGEVIETVNSFCYVGVTLTQQLSYSSMAKEQTLKAKRVLASILAKLYEYGQLPIYVFFNIFDTKISAILLYGSDIWGIQKHKIHQKLYIIMLVKDICVWAKNINAAVLGDCGRFPMYINAAKRSIKYWCKILNMGDDRYVRKSYLMMKYLDD